MSNLVLFEEIYGPIQTGINEASIDVAKTSNLICVKRRRTVTFSFAYTKDTGTGLQFYIEDSADGTNWARRPVLDPSTGVYTLPMFSVAFEASGTFAATFDVVAGWTRVASLLATGAPGVGDLASVTITCRD